MLKTNRSLPKHDDLTDQQLVALVRARDDEAARILVRRHNRLLFRIARGVVRNDDEAEDIVQETYVRAFTGLDAFHGHAALSTWLTRIALNEAYGRIRRRRATVEFSTIEASASSPGGQVIMFPLTPPPASPETEVDREQVRRFLEIAIDRLPDAFRMVFVLRDVEGLDTEEAATLLSIRPETVKTRLFRARRLMRAEIENALAGRFQEVFPFDGERCVNMANRVIARLLGETP